MVRRRLQEPRAPQRRLEGWSVGRVASMSMGVVGFGFGIDVVFGEVMRGKFEKGVEEYGGGGRV